jgi:hypothetical protein
MFSFGIIAVLVIVVNVYVAYHDDGILKGRVLGPDGNPITEATVTLYKPGVVGLDKIAVSFTNVEGEFYFEKHNQHHPVLKAEKDEVGESKFIDVRLYFQNQNRVRIEPIVLGPPL